MVTVTADKAASRSSAIGASRTAGRAASDSYAGAGASGKILRFLAFLAVSAAALDRSANAASRLKPARAGTAASRISRTQFFIANRIAAQKEIRLGLRSRERSGKRPRASVEDAARAEVALAP